MNKSSARGLMANVVISEFELQSRYYVHFRINTFEKFVTPLFFQLWVK